MSNPQQPLDIQSAIEQGKSILTKPPTTPESVKETLESLSSGVEQVRYMEGERLSSTGQAVLKDLEQVLTSGAEVSEAIPQETFLHAARAQKEVMEAIHPEQVQVSQETEEEAKATAMDFGKLLKTVVASSEFRHFVSDFMIWLRSALLEVASEATEPASQKAAAAAAETEIGQVPTEQISVAESVKLPAIPDDQLDRFIGLLEWSQDRPEYQKAVGFVFNQLSQIPEFLGINEEEEEEAGTGESEPVIDKEALQKALQEAKQAACDSLKALENWTHRSFSGFQVQLQKTAQNMQNDTELRNAVTSLGHFLSNCFTQPGFLNDRQWIRDESSELIGQFRARLSGENRTDFQCLLDESRQVVEAISDEPRTAHLKESLRCLLEDLFISKEQGEGGLAGFQLKTELMSDLGVIIGGLMERVRLVRLPDLEVHDEEFDFTAHNIVLDAAELIPQQFKLTLVTENMLERAKNEAAAEGDEPVASASAGMSLSEEQKHALFVERNPAAIEAQQPAIIAASTSAPASPWATFLKFEVKGVRGHCKGLHFTMRKRAGFPQLSDEGVADLRVWGREGMLIKVVLKPEWIIEESVTQTVTTTTETKQTPQVIEKPEKSSPIQIPSQTTQTGLKVESFASAPPRQKLKLTVVKARCSIDELDLDLHGTRHSWFYTVLGPLVRKKVKSALEGAVERNLLALMD